MAGDSAPLVRTLRVENPGAVADADAVKVIGVAPFAGHVSAVRYLPDTDITGADTESRTLTVTNRGADGDGTDVVATQEYETGVDAAQYAADGVTVDETYGTPADRTTQANYVAAGDVLTVESTHIGSTGLADPGGLVEVDLARYV